MTKQRLLWRCLAKALACAALLGCPGPIEHGPGANTFNGTVAGSSLTVQRAVWSNPGSEATVIAVSLTSVEDACEIRKMNATPVPAFFFLLQGTSPGTYPVERCHADPGKGCAYFAHAVMPNGSSETTYTSEGTITVDSVVQGASPVVKGSFDVKFGTDQVTGTFEATPCPP